MLKKLKQLLKPENMMFKMVALNCGILLLVAVVITTAGNTIYQNSMEESSYAKTMEIQNQVLKSLDLIFQSVSDNVSVLGAAPQVQGYLKVDEQNEQAKRVCLEGEVRDILVRYSDTYEDYLNIVIVSEKGHYLSNDSYRMQKNSLTLEDWYQKAMDANGELVLTGSSLRRNLKSWKNYSTDSYVSAVQMVPDEETGRPLGVILVDLDIQSIQNLVEDITMGQTGFGYIQDSNGKVLYAPKNKVVYRMNPQWFTSEKGGQVRCSIEGQMYNVIYSRSSYTDLTAVGVFDWGKTIAGAFRVRQVSVWIAVVIAIFAIACSVAFSASITKPISKLSKLMKRAQTGDLTVRFENPYKGEIHQLGDAFNSMVAKTDELLKLVYQEQKDKREAELQILHEQIKPHFLYNTLDTISWMAKEYQAKDIVDIVLALSNFFRISLSQGREFISLEQEIAMGKSYLDIQKFRYEELFDYETDIEESIGKCEVPRLSLQPLIENALYHGIKESEREHGIIWIKAYQKEEMIFIQVEDDGAGMTQERCRQLNEWLAQKERREDADAFGSLNVNDRVRMAYGEEYGLRYCLREGGGVIAQLKLKRTK